MIGKTATKQPKGFYILFFNEAWDRLIFYGIQSLLIIYLTRVLLFSDYSAYTTYGSYTTLAFSMPLLGGFLADRLIGYQKCIKYGIFSFF